MNVLLNPNVRYVYGGLFGFDGDWIHPDRTEATWELISVTSGEVYMTVEGSGEIRAAVGDLMLLEPGVRHYGSRVSRGAGFYWAHFELDGELPFGERFFEGFSGGYMFRELLHHAFSPVPHGTAVNAVLVRILAELECFRALPRRQDRLCAEIYEWTRVHASAKLTAERVARRFCVSSDHLTRLMRRHYGVGMKHMLDGFLVDRARDLLANSGRYVKEIADDLGFSSSAAFIGFFRYHTSVTPADFRRRSAGIHMNAR